MINIVSQHYRIFHDRREAGILLARALKHIKKDMPATVVIGIPRGGIVVAQAIAQELSLPFDIVLVGKLAAPHQPELAIGAIAEQGTYFINRQLCSLLKIDKVYLAEEKRRKLEQLKEKGRKYRAVKPRIPLANKTVIITDDGIATGASLQAALTLVKQENPALLLAAVPVGPMESIRQLERFCDEIICLESPDSFGAVGEFYENFMQTTDEEVIAILKENMKAIKV